MSVPAAEAAAAKRERRPCAALNDDGDGMTREPRQHAPVPIDMAKNRTVADRRRRDPVAKRPDRTDGRSLKAPNERPDARPPWGRALILGRLSAKVREMPCILGDRRFRSAPRC